MHSVSSNRSNSASPTPTQDNDKNDIDTKLEKLWKEVNKLKQLDEDDLGRPEHIRKAVTDLEKLVDNFIAQNKNEMSCEHREHLEDLKARLKELREALPLEEPC